MMDDDSLETDVVDEGRRRTVGGRRAAESRHRMLQNHWTLPEAAPEAPVVEDPNRRRRKKKTRPRQESEDGAGESAAAWESGGNATEEKGRRRRRRKQEKPKEPFSSVARCRNSDIRITLADEGLVWSPVDNTAARRGEAYTLPYERILKAQPGETETSFLLNYVDRAGSLLRQKTMDVLVGDVAVAKKWIKYTTQIISSLFSRPRRARVLIHTSAGRGNAAALFKLHALTKLREMGVETDIIELKSADDFLQDINAIENLTEYDSLLVVGNQLSFRYLLNAVMSRVHSEQDIDLRPGTAPLPSPLPIGLLPVSRRADLVTSLHATSDFTTALNHFLIGMRMPVDVAAVFKKSDFIGWAFNCQYGFGANALSGLPCDRPASDKRAETSLAKALAKGKLLSYDCDIHYIPSRLGDVSYPTDNKVCHAGCNVCAEADKRRKKNSVTYDQVVELDPLGESHHSGSMIELKEENPWVTVKGSYLWIGLYSVPCRNELMAPHGLSPCAHFSDGCADLILVRECRRKDFLRFLKRHGSVSKNPLLSSFVETHRVTALRFQARQNITWEHRDFSKTEIDYQLGEGRGGSASTTASSGERSEAEVRSGRRRAATEVEVVIDDCTDDDEDDEDGDDEDELRIRGPQIRSAQSVCTLDLVDDSSSCAGSDGLSTGHGSVPETVEEPARPVKKKGLRRLSLFSLKTTEASSVETKTYIKPRVTPSERERQRRMAKARGKEEKLRRKAEDRLRSSWILDYEPCADTELEFQIHSHVVTVYGSGPVEDARMEDSRLSWLPLF